jgi:hypothetical protein
MPSILDRVVRQVAREHLIEELDLHLHRVLVQTMFRTIDDFGGFDAWDVARWENDGGASGPWPS